MSELGSLKSGEAVRRTWVVPCRVGGLSRNDLDRAAVRGTLLATCLAVFGACDVPADRGGVASDGPSTESSTVGGTPIRQSFHLEVPVAPIPVATGGNRRLVYELHLINFAREALGLERLDVVDADDGTVLTNVGAADLSLRLGGPAAASSQGEGTVLAPGMLGIIYLEIDMAGEEARSLEHRLTYRSAAAGPEDTATVRGGRTAVSAEHAVVLSSPVRGGPWVAVYHPSWQRGHRRVAYAIGGSARIPGRFAVDWFRVDSVGLRASPPEDEVANCYGYGEDVLAVADGEVVAVRTEGEAS